ncbi:Helix-turn-helix domain-containing protein [Micromonospora pattaloongensis]|uniref:Helix-turn-helix domain-containing protein n=1 Tax=Micromonospora pattaloongensis TaxID=405436 RepID=A0A1H3M0Y4_9ACTN|nr:helix-turn-helix domain-containing protein [Micromonospora pattaloongensis]SDY70223.1 Helix-turn-helix domain-containing protein [Micromonospora pattaloongensis]
MWEEGASRHPAIRTIWRAHVEEPGRYLLAANEFWGISFIRHTDGTVSAELDGPTVQARTTTSVRGEDYWGLELRAHVFVQGVEKMTLLEATHRLPVTDDCVLLGGCHAPVPRWGGLEDFVDSLLAAGALVADEDVRRALRGDYSGLARRTWQRRFRAVTGLSPKQVQQLQRARHAYVLLQSGMPAAEAAVAAGFADQSHLTRSLRRIRNETPARIIATHLRSAAQRDAFVQDSDSSEVWTGGTADER